MQVCIEKDPNVTPVPYNSIFYSILFLFLIVVRIGRVDNMMGFVSTNVSPQVFLLSM